MDPHKKIAQDEAVGIGFDVERQVTDPEQACNLSAIDPGLGGCTRVDGRYRATTRPCNEDICVRVEYTMRR